MLVGTAVAGSSGPTGGRDGESVGDPLGDCTGDNVDVSIGRVTGAAVGLVGTRVGADTGVSVPRDSTGAGVSGISISTGRPDGASIATGAGVNSIGALVGPVLGALERPITGDGVGEEHTHSHSVGLDVGARGRCSTGAFVCFGINAFGLLVGFSGVGGFSTGAALGKLPEVGSCVPGRKITGATVIGSSTGDFVGGVTGATVIGSSTGDFVGACSLHSSGGPLLEPLLFALGLLLLDLWPLLSLEPLGFLLDLLEWPLPLLLDLLEWPLPLLLEALGLLLELPLPLLPEALGLLLEWPLPPLPEALGLLLEWPLPPLPLLPEAWGLLLEWPLPPLPLLPEALGLLLEWPLPPLPEALGLLLEWPLPPLPLLPEALGLLLEWPLPPALPENLGLPLLLEPTKLKCVFSE